VKEEKASAHWEVPSLMRSAVTERGGKYSLRGELSDRGAEDKAKGNLNRLLMLVSSPQPKMLVHSTTRAGGACVLRLGLWRSGPTDRTGVGCVKTV